MGVIGLRGVLLMALALATTVALTAYAVGTAVGTLGGDAPPAPAATTAVHAGDVAATTRALATLLWVADGNTIHCPEDALYWFNGHYSRGLGWERECIPIDDLSAR